MTSLYSYKHIQSPDDIALYIQTHTQVYKPSQNIHTPYIATHAHAYTHTTHMHLPYIPTHTYIHAHTHTGTVLYMQMHRDAPVLSRDIALIALIALSAQCPQKTTVYSTCLSNAFEF